LRAALCAANRRGRIHRTRRSSSSGRGNRCQGLTGHRDLDAAAVDGAGGQRNNKEGGPAMHGILYGKPVMIIRRIVKDIAVQRRSQLIVHMAIESAATGIGPEQPTRPAEADIPKTCVDAATSSSPKTMGRLIDRQDQAIMLL